MLGGVAAALLAAALGSCTVNPGESDLESPPNSEPAAASPAGHARSEERERMVRQQIAARDVSDERVLAAMRAVPRHEFMPEAQRPRAYEDGPLPIGHGQTISQPYIVAAMTALADLQAGEKVLEVGTGSGYQAAVLVAMGVEVYSIEIVEPLGRRAAGDLQRLGYPAHLRIGDGYQGWPEEAPFDAILVTAAPDHVPQPLVDQLALGGRMVIPVGSGYQELVLLRRDEEGVHRESVAGVRFVPMTGEAQE